MAALLGELQGKKILVLTNDGRHLVGVLKGVDKVTNIVLASCVEYIYAQEQGVQTVDLGLMLLKGDNVALAGRINQAKEDEIDLETIRAPPLKAIKH